MDDSSLTLNKRIRNAQLEQFNVILVVGEKEVENRTVNVRERGNKKAIGEMSLEVFYKYLEKKGVKKSNAELDFLFNGMVRGKKDR